MAISEIPSLHLKPVAYKTNKLYLKLPEGSIGNMTFARTSIARRTNKEGLNVEVATGIPRLDYPFINGVVQSCPELLLEPTRTNLLLRSEEIDNAIWSKPDATVLANATVSPDGTTNADKVRANATNIIWVAIFQTTTTVAETTYTFSGFIKPAEVTFIQIAFGTGDVPNNPRVNFELTGDGIIGTQDADIDNAKIILIPNGWYYIEITVTTAVAETALRPYIQMMQSLTDGRFQTNSWNINDGFYIWGADLQLDAYATSHIKTTNTTEARATEILNNVGDSTTFNSVEGILYVEMAALYDDGTNRSIAISDGTSSNRVFLRYSSTSNTVDGLVIVGGVTQANMNFAVSDVTEFSKIVLKWKVNDFALWADGVEVDTDNSGSIFPIDTLTELSFDNSVGGDDLFGRARELKVYKTALTDTELEELTT